MAKTAEIATDRPYEAFLAFVQSKVAESTDYQVTDQLATEQVSQIAVADSLDDLFGAMKMQGLTGLRDLDHGTDLEILGYRIVRSTRDDLSGRTGVFAIIDAVDLFDGAPRALDTGIERVLAFLIKCEQLGRFPVRVRVLKKSTQSGNEIITFGPIPTAAK